MISQIYILSLRGDILYQREFKPDLPKNLQETFFREIKTGTAQNPKPFFTIKGITFAWLDLGTVYLIATTGINPSPSLMITTLRKISENLIDFLTVLTEDSIRRNFFMVYEIIDEMIVNGNCQIMDACDVKNFVVSTFQKLKTDTEVSTLERLDNYILKFMANKQKGKNVSILESQKGKAELFVDLVEKISMKFNKVGWILSSEIFGEIKAKAYLKSNSDVHISTNFDKVNSKMCCLFGSFVSDEEFKTNGKLKMKMFKGTKNVMKYRIMDDKNTPILFKVHPFVTEIGKNKAEVCLKISNHYSPQVKCKKLLVRMKVPKDGSYSFKFSEESKQEDQKVEVADDEILWEICQFKGSEESTLKITASLSDSEEPIESRFGFVKLEFEIFNFSASGFTMSKVNIVGHQSKDVSIWARRCTRSSSYIKEI